MPFFYDFDKLSSASESVAASFNAKRTATNLLELRQQLDNEVPRRSIFETLLLATWNIQAFGASSRTGESLWYIEEILSRFDLIAVQEVKRDLGELDRVCKLLGPWLRYLVTDSSEGDGGNDERLAFLFDTRKVRFGGMAGEIVLPPVKDKNGKVVKPDQLFRTPYIAGSKAGWFDFMLSTVHIKFGKNKRADPGRLTEIQQVAKFLAKRATQTGTWSRNMILLGDFNIFDAQSPTFKALMDAGFNIPDEIQSLPVTNVGSKPRIYDQIAFLLGDQQNIVPLRAGVLDFFETIYSDAKFTTYEPGLVKADGSKPGNAKSYYRNHWRRRQMSDHLLMWVELPIEFAEPYLSTKAGG